MKISVVMPAFNEAETIQEFLGEIIAAARDDQIEIHVFDDYSTDSMAEKLSQFVLSNSQVRVTRNDENMGHGKTTLRALASAVYSRSDVVVSTDGDGNVSALGLIELAKIAHRTGKLVEGVRVSRINPMFRVLTSFATRVLVWLKSGIWPKDANTPHRAYPTELLSTILPIIPATSPIPNLMISALVRSQGLSVIEHPIVETARIGAQTSGVTWGQRFSGIPSARFVKFCGSALVSWSRFDVARGRESIRRWPLKLLGRASIGRYGLIGLSGVVIDFSFFWILSLLGVNPILASVIGTSAGIGNNYLLNSSLNFRVKVGVRRGSRYLAVGLVGLLLSAGLLKMLLIAGAAPITAKVITIPFVVGGQFLANRYWTFKEQD